MNFDLDKDFAEFEKIVEHHVSSGKDIQELAEGRRESSRDQEEEKRSLGRAWELFQGSMGLHHFQDTGTIKASNFVSVF